MTATTENIAPVIAYSVGELVRRRLGEVDDPWLLALVQRDLSWEDHRIKGLLDSVLMQYPIGSLLLCTVRQNARASDQRKLRGEAKDLRDASGSPQLLDGQQRIYALSSIFSKTGHGRAFVSMTAARESGGISSRTGSSDKTLKYIVWHENGSDDLLEFEQSLERRQFVDLSLWHEFAKDKRADELTEHFADLGEGLNRLDGGFDLRVLEPSNTVARERINAIIKAWTEPLIPAVRATLDSPEQLLELFTRVNRGGVVPHANDIYFAAIKTVWQGDLGAEIILDKVVKSSSPDGVIDPPWSALNRWTALSLISRLAAAGLNFADPIPLKADVLSGEKGKTLVEATEHIAQISPARINTFVNRLVTPDTSEKPNNQLWLRHVNPLAWEEVFAWVITRAGTETSGTWIDDNMEAIEAYLVGSTMFRYHYLLGNKFRHAAFRRCMEAGAKGENFPLAEILEDARWDNEELKGPRGAQVRAISESTDIARDANALLVSHVQGLPLSSGSLDWDHIVPYNSRNRMRNGRRIHEVSQFLSHPANFWWLDASVNRALQDRLPDDGKSPEGKFQQLETWRKDPQNQGWRIWDVEHWAMPEDDLPNFEKIGSAIENGDLKGAYEIFNELAQARVERMIESAFSAFPGARDFARDAERDSAASSSELVREVSAAARQALGINYIHNSYVQRERETKTALARQKASTVFDLGPGWGDLGDRIYRIWDRAGRELAGAFGINPVPPRQSESGDKIHRWIRIWDTDPDLDTGFVRFGIDAARARDGHSPLFIKYEKHRSDYGDVKARLEESAFENQVDIDETGVFIDLAVDPDVDEDSTVQVIVEEASQFCIECRE